jgi:hypothetical protein
MSPSTFEVKVEVGRWVDVVGEIEDAVMEEEVIGVAEVDMSPSTHISTTPG